MIDAGAITYFSIIKDLAHVAGVYEVSDWMMVDERAERFRPLFNDEYSRDALVGLCIGTHQSHRLNEYTMMQHSNLPQRLYSLIPYSILQGEDYTPTCGPVYPGASHLPQKVDRYNTTRGVIGLAEYNRLSRETRPPVLEPQFRHLCETWVKYHAGTPEADKLYSLEQSQFAPAQRQRLASEARRRRKAPNGKHSEGRRTRAMQIGALIRRAALYYGDAPCLVEGERVVSFREFDALTDRLGNALIKRGFEAGDRIGVLLPNGIDCLVAYYALAKAGLVRVSLNTRETLADHAYKLSHSGSRGVICNDVQGLDVEIAIGSQELAELQRSGSKAPCAVDRDLDAPYRLGFTGGTTGRSKAVTLTMRGELAELSAFLTDLLPEILQGQTFLHAAPIAHASGAFFLPSLVRGARSLIMAKFDPEEFVHLAATEQAELTFLVPTMLAMVLEAPSIDEAPVRPALHRVWRLAHCACAA